MAPELTCVDREHVRTEFYRICSEETKDAKRVAFTRLLETLFQEYPQEEDEQGRMWIWKVQP
jgi:hypothetical protein